MGPGEHLSDCAAYGCHGLPECLDHTPAVFVPRAHYEVQVADCSMAALTDHEGQSPPDGHTCLVDETSQQLDGYWVRCACGWSANLGNQPGVSEVAEAAYRHYEDARDGGGSGE